MDSCRGVKRIVWQDGGVQRVVECAEIDGRRNGAGDTVGSPNIVIHVIAGFPVLAHKDLLSPLRVEEEIESAGLGTFEYRAKIGLWILRKAVFENAQGLGGVELRDEGIRERSEGGIQ